VPAEIIGKNDTIAGNSLPLVNGRLVAATHRKSGADRTLLKIWRLFAEVLKTQNLGAKEDWLYLAFDSNEKLSEKPD
jgi:hypothetical protein